MGAAGLKAENITVNDVTVGRGGKAKMNVNLTCEDNQWFAFQMDITLPEGFSMKNNSAGIPEVVYTDRLSSVFSTAASNYRTAEGYYSIAGVHMGTAGIVAGSGPIFYMTIVAGDDVTDGTYTGTIRGIIFTNSDDQSVHFDNATFTITVSGDAVTGIAIDETSTEALTATTEATGVTVKRTIKADEWSTLVLPFAMTGDELASAFGETAKLAEFTEWSPSDDEDSDGNPLSINMTFKTKALSEGIEANHPVLIRLDHAITEFTVEDKMLDPEDEPTVTVNKTGSTKKRDQAMFYGSYVPVTIEEKMLFLNGNSFYYSTGKTKMKGFRGYFYVPDVISDYYSTSTSSKVSMTITDETTGINEITTGQKPNGRIYNIAGQYVGTDTSVLPTGIYIMNGKKVFVK